MEPNKQLKFPTLGKLGRFITWPIRRWRITATFVIFCVIAPMIIDQVQLRMLATQREAIRKAGGALSFSDFNLPNLDDKQNAAIVYRFVASQLKYPGNDNVNTAELCGRYRSTAVCKSARKPPKGDQDNRYEPLSSEELRLIEEHVALNEENFKLLREAQALPGCQINRYDNPVSIVEDPESYLPRLTYMRELARNAATKAIWEYRQGNVDAAYEWVATVMHIANDSDSEPFLICGLVRVACAGIALEALQAMLCEADLPEPLPPTLINELDRLADRSLFARTLQGERCFSNAMYKSSSDAGGLMARVLIHTPNQIRINDMLTTLAEAASETDYDKRQAILKPLKEIEPPDIGAVVAQHRVLADMLAPALLRGMEAFERMDAQTNGARIAIALKQYKRDNGEYPGELSGLEPHYIEELPQDPYSGNSFIYRREGEGFVVYSVGPSGVDDGGQPLSGPFSGDLPWFATR